MKSFSIHRFGLLLKLNLLVNRRAWLSLSLGLLICNAMCQFGSFFTSVKLMALTRPVSLPAEIVWANAFSHLRMCLFFVTWVIIFAGFSMTCQIFKTKGRRIYWLTLPATNLEKWLCRLLLCTVGVLVLHFAAFLVTDLLRMALLSTQSVPPGSALPGITHAVGENVQQWLSLFTKYIPQGVDASVNQIHGAWVALYSLSFVLLTCAAYLLGAALFRRSPFWKTTGILFAIALLMGYVLAQVDVVQRSVTIDSHIIPLSVILFSLLTAAFVWLSYRLFCRMPVTRRKLF